MSSQTRCYVERCLSELRHKSLRTGLGPEERAIYANFVETLRQLDADEGLDIAVAS